MHNEQIPMIRLLLDICCTARESSNSIERMLVDRSLSHTHAPGRTFTTWTWKVGGQQVGTGATTNFTLPVGDHVLTLLVVDDGGNESTDATSIALRTYGYPVVLSISPDQGGLAGGDQITIIGSRLNPFANATTVHIGDFLIEGHGCRCCQLNNDNCTVSCCDGGYTGSSRHVNRHE